MKATSLLAWSRYQFALPQARRAVYHAVLEHEGATGREIERITGDRKANARLSELERHGLIETRSTRQCAVTGHAALSWWPVETPSLRPLPKRVSRADRLRVAVLSLCVGRTSVQVADVLRVLAGAA